MYKYADSYLRCQGYEHYEVSSYALIPTGSTDNKRVNLNRSVHNQIYWGLDTQWYAFGLGATSYLNGQLVARPRALADYHEWVNQQMIEAATNQPIFGQCNIQVEPDLDKMMDIVLKRLRTSEGLSLQWIRNQFANAKKEKVGEAYIGAILKGAELGVDLGLAEIDDHQDILLLQQPDGFLFSNSIISSIFVSMEEIQQ